MELQIQRSISTSIKYSGLISFRIDGFDLLAVQGSLKTLLQHHNLEVSILWCSSFIIIQPSHPYMTTGKTTALTIRTFVGKEVQEVTLSFKQMCWIPGGVSADGGGLADA